MNLLAFDLETARLTPDGEDWHAHRPLGISCYALAWRNEGAIKTVVGHAQDGAGSPQPQMSRAECRSLVEELADKVSQGYTLLTWNGLGFDFNVLAEEAGMHSACCELARAHVDMMFHFFCLQGYPLGLDTAAKGMGLAGKVEGMDGAQAPILWQQGQYAESARVCDPGCDYDLGFGGSRGSENAKSAGAHGRANPIVSPLQVGSPSAMPSICLCPKTPGSANR